jgi:hypothetical protein
MTGQTNRGLRIYSFPIYKSAAPEQEYIARATPANAIRIVQVSGLPQRCWPPLQLLTAALRQPDAHLQAAGDRLLPSLQNGVATLRQLDASDRINMGMQVREAAVVNHRIVASHDREPLAMWKKLTAANRTRADATSATAAAAAAAKVEASGPSSHLWQLLRQLHEPASKLHTKLIKHHLTGGSQETAGPLEAAGALPTARQCNCT